jgi:LPXTG-motif cell wall-anchored protein
LALTVTAPAVEAVLAATGASTEGPLLLALGLLVAGSGLLYAGRRRYQR